MCMPALSVFNIHKNGFDITSYNIAFKKQITASGIKKVITLMTKVIIYSQSSDTA